MNDLQEYANVVHRARKDVEFLRAQLVDLQDQLDASELGQSVASAKIALKEAKERTADVESKLKELAVKNYKDTGDKKPHPAVTIKIFSTVEIIDRKAALTWTVQNASKAVKLDSIKFKAAVKNLDELSFIKKDTEHRATLSSKLSLYEEV